MAKNKFLLVNLQEDQAKKLAQAITNETGRKILDFLADNDGTESEISEKLGIPISSAHYNIQQLVKSGLVTAEEFHYSKKGREVLHYKLANKYIIIAPKSTFGIKEKLKAILPVALLGIIGAAFIQLFNLLSGMFSATTEIVPYMSQPIAAKSAPVADKAVDVGAAEVIGAKGAEAAEQGAGQAAEKAAEDAVQAFTADAGSQVAEGTVSGTSEAAERVAEETVRTGGEEAVSTGTEQIARAGADEAITTGTDQAIQAAANEAAEEGVREAVVATVQSTQESFWQVLLSNHAFWFLMGCFFTIILIVLIEFIIYRKRNK